MTYYIYKCKKNNVGSRSETSIFNRLIHSKANGVASIKSSVYEYEDDLLMQFKLLQSFPKCTNHVMEKDVMGKCNLKYINP